MSEHQLFTRIEPTKFWLGTIDEIFGKYSQRAEQADEIPAHMTTEEEDELKKHLRLLERRRLRRMQSQNALQRVIYNARATLVHDKQSQSCLQNGISFHEAA